MNESIKGARKMKIEHLEVFWTEKPSVETMDSTPRD
jgi:hypothetical protein